MQKFKGKLKNVPRNTSLVPCSTNLELNRDQSLSASDGLKDSKLTLNNPEVNQVQQTERLLKAKVFVLPSGRAEFWQFSYKNCSSKEVTK